MYDYLKSYHNFGGTLLQLTKIKSLKPIVCATDNSTPLEIIESIINFCNTNWVPLMLISFNDLHYVNDFQILSTSMYYQSSTLPECIGITDIVRVDKHFDISRLNTYLSFNPQISPVWSSSINRAINRSV